MTGDAPPPAEASSPLRRWAGPTALGAGILVLFSGVFAGESLFFRDIYLICLPIRAFVAEGLRSGNLPLWDPLRHGGMPLLGPQVSLFSAGFFPFLLLDPVSALNAVVLLHVAAAAAAAWALARRLGLSREGATACGAVFAFSGYLLSSVNLLQPLLGLPWIPIAATFFSAFLRSGSAGALAGAAAAAAVPLLAGSPEVAVVLMAFLGLMAAVPPVQPAAVPAVRRIPALVIVAFLAVTLAGIQVVPSLEMVRESTRGEGAGYASFSYNSLHPARLPELLTPGVLGPVTHLRDEDYWGRSLVDGDFPYTLSIYLGGLAFSLALAGAILKASPLRASFRSLLLAGCAAALLVTLGRYLPGFPIAWQLAGPLAVFRYPVKAFAFLLLPVGLLAGAGVDAVVSPGRRAPVGIALLLGALSTAGIAAWVLPVAAPGAAAALEARWFGAPLEPGQQPALRAAFLHLGLFALLGSALLLASRLRGAGSLLGGVLAGSILADLVLAGLSLNPTAPRALLSEPRLVGTVSALSGGGRLFRDDDPVPFSVRALSNDVSELVRIRIESLSSYTAASWGIPVVFHVDYDRLAPARVAGLAGVLRKEGWGRRLPLLRAADARLVLTWDRIGVAGYSLALEIPAPGGGALRLYSVEGSVPARFAWRARTAPGADEATAMLLSRAGAGGEVILEGEAGNDPPEGRCSDAPVRLTRLRPEALRAEVDAPCPGWVVFAETWYPGWRARVDGRPAAILRADVAFRAVRVEPGRHVVEMEYFPRSLVGGALLSLLGLAILAVLLLSGRVARGGRRMS